MPNSHSDNDITPRRRYNRQSRQDDVASGSTSEYQYPGSRTEIPDNVLRFPGVDSPPLDTDASTAVASDSDEASEMRMLRGTTARSESLSIQSADYQSETQSLGSTYHQLPPPLGPPLDPSQMVRVHNPNALIESEWRERQLRQQANPQAIRELQRDYVRYFHNNYQHHAPQPSNYQPDTGYVSFDYADAYSYDRRFEFTVIEVSLAAEHVLELALIQARRTRSGRLEPSDRERQLIMNAPFLLTYQARRELHGGEARRSAAVDSSNRSVSGMAHKAVDDAHFSISWAHSS